jgi:hypothetical protein
MVSKGCQAGMEDYFADARNDSVRASRIVIAREATSEPVLSLRGSVSDRSNLNAILDTRPLLIS